MSVQTAAQSVFSNSVSSMNWDPVTSVHQTVWQQVWNPTVHLWPTRSGCILMLCQLKNTSRLRSGRRWSFPYCLNATRKEQVAVSRVCERHTNLRAVCWHSCRFQSQPQRGRRLLQEGQSPNQNLSKNTGTNFTQTSCKRLQQVDMLMQLKLSFFPFFG